MNSEQEIGDGYFKLTNCSFDKYTGYYQMEGEILDESHHTIGNLTVDGFPLYAYQDDHKVNIEYGIKLNLEGNIEKISSLKNI